MHPALRRWLTGTPPRLAAYMGGLAGLGYAAVLAAQSLPVTAAITNDPKPDWIEVARPYRAFTASVPELGNPEPRYAIRRHATGGGRKDVLTWGEPDGVQLTIEIYRPGTELAQWPDPANPFAAADMDLRLNGLEPIGSKFGPLLPLETRAPIDGQVERCLGFTHDTENPRIELGGRLCTHGPEFLNRALLACAMDRLTLLAAGSDPRTAEFFAKAEMRRRFCGTNPSIGAAVRHGDGGKAGAKAAMAAGPLAR
ncbi:MAG: hypothetical protein ACLPKB_34995 [Xanthobacteraceae bacterium]